MNAFRPAILFQDGCVLQRSKPITVWGEGRGGARVTVTLAGASASCQVKDGKWECILPAMEAARELTMELVCAGGGQDAEGEPERITLRHVSVGEVWMAGGQSNMEYFLRYDAQWEDTQCLPKNEDIHMFNVARISYEGQKKDVSDSDHWFGEGDAAWETFSAPGYSFARSIQPILGVPVGIIGCNWGGSTAATWMDESYLEPEPIHAYLRDYEDAVRGKDPERLKEQARIANDWENSPERETAWAGVMYGISRQEQREWIRHEKQCPGPENPMGPYCMNRPGRLYHMMLERIIPYSMRGVLWYQGETDECHSDMYDSLFSAMIRCFRDSFRQELPFLFVQLAPYGQWLEGNGLQYPELRRRQEMVSRRVPDVHMVSIMDLGMYEDIHPKHKMEVGERLALLARGKIYGETELLCESPEFSEAQREGDEIRLRFDRTGMGLWEAEPVPEAEAEAEEPSVFTGPREMKDGFVVSQNGVPLPIREVSLQGREVALKVDGLTEGPCQVDFAQVPYIRVRIYNEADLPMKPFSATVY